VDAEPTLTRRTVLVAGMTAAGAAGAAIVAGCSNGSKAAAGSGGTTGSGGSASSGSTPAAGATLAKVSDIPVGNAISATLDGQPILISQPVAGTVVAFTAICTHQGCTVAPAGKEFHCPCHGSVYDAATGAVKQGPAPAALAKIPTHIADGEVVSGA
jgi:cytochrome b6-f complex iron-sulfur subunit